MLNRREFCKQATLISLASTVPAFLARTARGAEVARDERILVVIQLDGGNDGLNTVIPFADENYSRLRPKLAVAKDRVLRVNDAIGLNPAMRATHKLWEDGRLTIVQGVGYPNPNKSHDVSMAIWQTARFDLTEHRSYGWIGRALDEAPSIGISGASALLVGHETMPVTLRGRKSVAASLANLNDLRIEDVSTSPMRVTSASDDDLAAYISRSRMDAFAASEQLKNTVPPVDFSGNPPEGQLGQRLAIINQLIKSNFGARVYYAVHSGYDTHAQQSQNHSSLLRELSDGLAFFLNDLKQAGLEDRVLVMAFSEFGRTATENASAGTDHGTAGPVLLAGSKIKPGLHGSRPNLAAVPNGDLEVTTDFRQVYQEVLIKWLNIPSHEVLKQDFEPLNLF